MENVSNPPRDLPERATTFHQWEWRVQRAAWIVWALIILAGLSGLLGSGPLSHQTARFPASAGILCYDRFLHYHHVTRLILELPAQTTAGPTRIWINQEYLDAVEIKSISPEPVAQRAADGGVVFEFDLATDAQNKLTFAIEPNEMGNLPGEIKAAPSAALSFQQFVYP